MTSRRHVVSLLACCCLALPAAHARSARAARPAGKLIFTGSTDVVWLVHCDANSRAFDLVLRKAEGPWQWVQQGLTGYPAAATASGRQLHVLFAHPTQDVVYSEDTGDSTTALTPHLPHWPAGAAPIAMAEALDANGLAPVGILAVVARPADADATLPASEPASRPDLTPPPTAPASAPATAPAAATTTRSRGRVHLAVFQRIGLNWTLLADLPNVRLAADDRVLVASADGQTYVLTSAGGGANRLTRWDGQSWHELSGRGGVFADEPLAMLAIGGRLVFVSSAPAEQPGRRTARIALLDANDTPSPGRPILRGTEPASWPEGQMPRFARLSEQLALLWQDTNSLRFATCVPRLGQLVNKGTVDVFDHPPSGGKAESLVANFMWVLLLSILVVMLIMRPRGPQAPFGLPETVRPGNLLKRVLAAVIDLMPINLLVFAAYKLSPWALSDNQLAALLDRIINQKPATVPISLAIASIAVQVLFLAYGTILEAMFGTTLGKKVMKLRVVGTGAARPGFMQCLLRNLVKIIELLSLQFPLLFLLPLVPIFTRYRQRFGDLVARTAVVDERSIEPAGPPPPPTDDRPDSAD